MYLGFGAVTLIVLGLLQNLLPMPKDTPFEHLFDRPRDAYLLAIIAVSFAPLLEELFFRGFLYPVVARRWGAAWGVFLAALPFALMHMQQYGYAWGIVLVIFIVGVVCGIVRVATRSVGASFLVHVGYNGIQMSVALVYTHGFRHYGEGGRGHRYFCAERLGFALAGQPRRLSPHGHHCCEFTSP